MGCEGGGTYAVPLPDPVLRADLLQAEFLRNRIHGLQASVERAAVDAGRGGIDGG